MKTFIINAHPDFTHQESYSNKLQTLFLKQFKERFPYEEPTIYIYMELKFLVSKKTSC